MTNLNDLIDRYIAIWNETDDKRRRNLVARTFTEDGHYVDPMMKGDGHAGIDAMIKGVQERFPGHKIARTGAIDTHNGKVRFTWALGPEGGAPIVGGVDFGTVAPDGRLSAITGFLDQVAQAA